MKLNIELPFVVCWCVVMLQSIILAENDLKCAPKTGGTLKNSKNKNNPIYGKLASFQGKRYKVQGEAYTYYFGICTTPTVYIKGDIGSVYRSNTEASKTNHTIGYFTKSRIAAGSNWVMLNYANGANCSSSLMIICNPHLNDNNEQMKVLEGSPAIHSECHYLFELEHSAMCVTQHLVTFSLSIGSILVITFVCVVLVYAIGGAVYNRVLGGAKGIEQIPNLAFWKDFGNLQADGCNFVFRSTEPRTSRPYKGIGDDQLEDTENDDHLLPM